MTTQASATCLVYAAGAADNAEHRRTDFLGQLMQFTKLIQTFFSNRRRNGEAQDAVLLVEATGLEIIRIAVSQPSSLMRASVRNIVAGAVGLNVDDLGGSRWSHGSVARPPPDPMMKRRPPRARMAAMHFHRIDSLRSENR